MILKKSALIWIKLLLEYLPWKRNKGYGNLLTNLISDFLFWIRAPQDVEALVPVLKVVADVLVFVPGDAWLASKLLGYNAGLSGRNKGFENPGQRGRRRPTHACSGYLWESYDMNHVT